MVKNIMQRLRWAFQRGLCLFVGLVFRVLFGLRGIDRPRLDGAYVLAPNHASFLDPMILQFVFPRHVTYLMDKALYELPMLRWFYRFWNVVPVPERGSALGAMKGALKTIRSGGIVGIFPEGRITRDGNLQRGQAGVGILMLKAKVPVVPVAIIGTYKVLPRGARFPRPGRLKIVFGEPIQPMKDVTDAKAAARELADRVMADIARLMAEHGPKTRPEANEIPTNDD